MTRKKLCKVLLVWLCIAALVLPFGSEVLAAALTGNETGTVKLESIPRREGGPESTGLTDPGYDETGYAYAVKGVNVLKIIQKDDTSYADTFYCVNAELSLSMTSSYDYEKVSDDFKVLSDTEVKAWADSVGISEDNYNSLIWLLENIYVKKQDSSYKDTFLKNAFATDIEEETYGDTEEDTIKYVKTYLTDDMIEVVQQWAVWYFTNGTNNANEYFDELYTSFGSVQVTVPGVGNTEDLPLAKRELAAKLYTYLVETAKSHEAPVVNPTYPSIAQTNPTSTVDGDYYKVGPFKVNSGNTAPSDFEMILTAVGGNLEDVNYKVLENGVEISKADFDGMKLDKEYYFLIPVQGNTITSLKLAINYTEMGERNITLWEDTTKELQPVVLLINKPGEEKSDEIVGRIELKEYDLALRKFIVSVNGDAVSGRTPVPTQESLRALAAGTVSTASYVHPKNAVPVKKGDKVVYEFRIYNEGDLTAKVQKLEDYLPEGVTVVSKSESTVNSRFDWTVDGRTVTNTYLSNTEIAPFNRDTLELTYVAIQLEVEITGDLPNGSTLTNVAQILLDNGDDRDSNRDTDQNEGIIDHSTITDSYSGDTSNPDDLGKTDYYYKGQQDDDDFEKLVIEGKQFDLSLKKFVSKVNSDDYSSDRAPSYDTTPLKNGGNDAKYTTSKNPINVEVGDIVTFTLRVYNEGDIAGYAEKITDYIPEGLGFLVNYKTNYDNKWAISSDAKSVKLSTIENGTKNLKLTDFEDVEKLEDVDVVVGKTKVTSTGLASSATSTANLIDEYKGGDTLSYKDIQISCIVLTDDAKTLKNIAAITKELDEDKNDVPTDRGSEDKDSTPKDDIDPDKYTTGDEDDDDYDVIKTDKKNFDLALQKFISAVNENKVTDRVPVITIKDGKVSYAKPNTNPLKVVNGDEVTYTIRVYNEGQIDGYAAEIMDDIPTGLKFLPDNSTNKEYGWKMYDKDGKETTDVNQAVQVKTTCLAKDGSKATLLKAFDGSTLSYTDVLVVFQIDESKVDKTVSTDKRTLKNTAEITKNTDEDGNDIPDTDSTPGNKNPNEDDIDNENVYVKYFDLALEKTLTKAVVSANGVTREIPADKEIKVEVQKKYLASTQILFYYTITVTNQGEIEGYASEVTDYIPDGLSFDGSLNPTWKQDAGRIISTNDLAAKLLQPGESASVTVVLVWDRAENNVGKYINVAEITEDYNPYNSPDVDSTPDNLVPEEDDYDTAPVWVGIVTGISGGRPYIILTSAVLMILATGIILIKKYAIK